MPDDSYPRKNKQQNKFLEYIHPKQFSKKPGGKKPIGKWCSDGVHQRWLQLKFSDIFGLL